MAKTPTKSSFTLPPSPSSSSSDFEFSMSVSPRKSSTALCPADELFYKGQLLPLHSSPRLSMVRTLLSSAADGAAAAARDSFGSSNDSHSLFTASSTTDCDSSRPSSVTEDDELLKRFHNNRFEFHREMKIKTNKYCYLFSLSRFSSVFRKEPGNNKTRDPDIVSGSSSSSVKRVSTNAREVIRKYLKKVKPLYEKISQKQPQGPKTTSFSLMAVKTERSIRQTERKQSDSGAMLSHSFSGNLRYPRRRRRSSCVSSCPSSPSHSGALSRGGFAGAAGTRAAEGTNYGGGGGNSSSAMEELQSAIQGAIAHCKSSWIQNKSTTVSDEI